MNTQEIFELFSGLGAKKNPNISNRQKLVAELSKKYENEINPKPSFDRSLSPENKKKLRSLSPENKKRNEVIERRERDEVLWQNGGRKSPDKSLSLEKKRKTSPNRKFNHGEKSAAEEKNKKHIEKEKDDENIKKKKEVKKDKKSDNEKPESNTEFNDEISTKEETQLETIVEKIKTEIGVSDNIAELDDDDFDVENINDSEKFDVNILAETTRSTLDITLDEDINSDEIDDEEDNDDSDDSE